MSGREMGIEWLRFLQRFAFPNSSKAKAFLKTLRIVSKSKNVGTRPED
jgi:hypothetical protein